MDINFNGKTALVCGSTQGIGRAIAEELANLGCSVTLCARNAQKLENVKSDLFATSAQKHRTLVADFNDPSQLQKVILDHISKGHYYHILINNTGGPPAGQAITADLEEFRVAFNQHLICNQILTQACVEGMKSEGYGRIINVISTSVKAPLKGLGVSNTIRGAVANWAKTLSNELGEFGITVNNVLPGATATQRLEGIIKNKAEKQQKTIEEAEEAMKDEIPAKRFAEPQEVAAAAVFLASPAAGYINGVNLPVDGGRLSNL